MEPGILFVLTGATGSGKTTISKEIVNKKELRLTRGITCTTRKPRNGEMHGIDYYFLTHEEFEEGIKNGDFIEHATVYGNHYGCRRVDIEEMARNGENQLRVLDVQGALTVRKKFNYPNSSIFISAGNLEDHRKRLLERGSDSPEEIERRLVYVPEELALAKAFDYYVPNGYGQQGSAVDLVTKIILSEYHGAGNRQ